MLNPDPIEKWPWVRLVVPFAISCLFTVFNVGCILTLHQHPELAWVTHAAMWSLIVASLALLPDYMKEFAPMLFVWAFWIDLQSDIAFSWRIQHIDQHYQPFNAYLYLYSLALLVLLSPALYPSIFGSRKQILIRSFISMIIVILVPKPPLPSEVTMIVQVAAFFLLFWSQHFVGEFIKSKHTPRFEDVMPIFNPTPLAPSISSSPAAGQLVDLHTVVDMPKMTQTIPGNPKPTLVIPNIVFDLGKLLGSSWALWVQNLPALVALTLLSFALTMFFFLVHYEHLEFNKQTFKFQFLKNSDKND